MPDLVGKTLTDRYHILAKLGEGGMGAVYQAQDTVRGCLVAVKTMSPYPQGDPQSFAERFRREAESLALLNHPHIVRFYELVEDARPPFLVMDYVEGQSLQQLLEARQNEPLPLAEAIRILYQIGGALHFAHQQGIYHRDVKPSNILIDRGGRAYLADFGIALLTDRTRLTTGEMPRTPIYAAPEQWKEEPVDARTDVYALGVLLYELLTGRPPFTGDFPALILKILEEPPSEPSQWNPDIPPRVGRVVLRALAKAKDDRYPDVATMLDALRAAQEASTDSSTPQQKRPLLIDAKSSVDSPALPAQPPPTTKASGRDGLALPAERPPHGRNSRRLLFLSVGGGLALLAILAGLILLGPGQRWVGRQPEVSPTVASLPGTPAPAALAVTPSPTLTPTPSPTASPASSPTPSPSPTLTLSPTPSPSLTPTSTPTPYLTVSDDHLNVYAGPGEGYEKLGQVHRGDRLLILGRSEDSAWCQVDYLGWPGWIAAQSVSANVNIQALSVVEAPPAPVNRVPSIQEIQMVSTTIEAWDAMALTCQASDPDGDPLTYNWAVTGGSITGEGVSITYYAPGSPGSQTITVTVRDGHGGEVEHSIVVQIVPAHPPPGMFEPANVFGQVWREHQLLRTLGWATAEESTTLAAEQFFEQGIMFWRQDSDQIYGLTQDGHWQVYEGIWKEGMDEYSCPDVAPSNTPPTPKRGFGEVWCLQMGGPNATIGWATTAEEGYDARWQAFEHGLMWQGKDGQIYALHEDSSWQAYPSP